MMNWSNLYVKYLIKNPLIFYLFLLIGAALFLFMTISLKLDVTQTTECKISGNTITISGEIKPVSEVIYLYTDRNDKIHKLTIESVLSQNGQTVIVFTNIAGLSREMKMDFVIAQQTLFERIFLEAGKG